MLPNTNIEGIMFELAVSIGTHTGCDLLQHTMPLLIEKLNCSGALVIRCTAQESEPVSNEGISGRDQVLLSGQAGALFAGLALEGKFTTVAGESGNFHVFLLSGFGVLALRFRVLPDSHFIGVFLQLVDLLANACRISEKLQNFCSQEVNYCEERNLLHAIIRNIPDPVYVKDKEGRKIILNKAEAELLGAADISEVLGKTDSDFYPEGSALKMEAEDSMIIETGQPVIHRDGLLITNTGKEIWVKGTKIPHFNEKGEVAGIIGISHNISEYKKIELDLRDVAEKYQAIFNSYLDLYYRSDLNGIILELSPSVYPLSGYAPEELIGKSVSQVYAEAGSRERMIQVMVEKGSVNDYENLFCHKSGRLVPVSITSHLIPSSNGKPGYIEGTIRDISERKEAEAKVNKLLKLQNLLTQLASEFINIPVEESNQAVDSLLSVIGNGNEIDRVYIFEYDFSKDTMSNTHEWCAQGISPEKDNLQQIPNNLLPGWAETHKRGEMYILPDLSKLDKDDSQYKILEPQGIKTLITIPLILKKDCIGFVGFDSVNAVKQWSPDEISFLKVLADLLCNVADRKRADADLRNREASLKAVFNNVPFQMWLKDVDGRYLSVNKPFMDYFSITSESDVIGKNAVELWHNEAAAHFMEQDQAVMENLELRSVEERVDFKHKTVWFEIFRAPIVSQNGQLLGTTGIARDISNRKAADTALQEAVKLAEAANKAKSRFLAIMSHEIRNPLNAVVGMVRMLHNAGITGPNSTLIQNIKTSSDHLLMIINDILDFSKIESGEMLLEERSFSIQELVTQVYDSQVYFAKEKHIGLTYHIDKSISGRFHKGDPLRLQQVLSNLTSNAIKFTQQGEIAIRCRLESETGMANRLYFEVEDSGIGISPENQEMIFESFKQENDTISRTYGGTGLGLAISKQIVELMGGKLGLESTKDIGSKFYFSIDMQTFENPDDLTHDKTGGVENYSLKGYSVLLVEDNKLNQILATAMLQKWGARVGVAGNGQQAVDILKKEAFDIILMDIQMPIMDGMTAAKVIRTELQLTTPILALSANVIKGIVEKCEEVGMQGYISKPFSADDLFRKIILQVTKKPKSDAIEVNAAPEIVIADISRLEKMIGSDQVQLNSMLNKFLEITPSYIAELNNGDEDNDLNAIASASHKIKSSVDLVSTPVMCDLIQKINQVSRHGKDLNEAKRLIKTFNDYYKILEKELRLEILAFKPV
jgi:PAS domain S-box-containing protein